MDTAVKKKELEGKNISSVKESKSTGKWRNKHKRMDGSGEIRNTTKVLHSKHKI